MEHEWHGSNQASAGHAIPFTVQLSFYIGAAAFFGAVLWTILTTKGVYMGVFNFFIVIPEILASLFFGWVMNHLLGNNRILAVTAGSLFMIAASILMQRVHDPGEETLRMSERVHGTPVLSPSPRDSKHAHEMRTRR